MFVPNFETIVRVASENRKGYWRERGVVATYPDAWIKDVAASVNTLPAGSENKSIMDFFVKQFNEHEEQFWLED